MRLGLRRPNLPGQWPLRRSVTTVHFEPDSVRVLVVRGGCATHWSIAPLEFGLVHDGLIADPPAVARQLKPLLAERGVGRRNLMVGLSGRQCITRLLSFPAVEGGLLKHAIPREIRRQTAVSQEETRFAWQIVGRDEQRIRVFALGAPPDVIDAQIEAVRLAGGSAASLGVKTLALTRAVGLSEALIVDVEPEAIEVIIVRDCIPAAIRTGSLRPGIDSDEDRVRRIEEELGRTLRYHEETHQGEPFAASVPAFLTGSLAPSVAESHVVEQASGHPLQPLPQPLRHPPDLPVESLMVNIGLALLRR